MAGAAAAPPEPSANLPAAQAEALPASEPVSPNDVAWTVSLASSAMVVGLGANVTLTATANQDVNGTLWSIVLLSGSTIVQPLCGFGTTCSWTVTSAIPASISYTGVIANSNASLIEAASDSVTVVWTNAPTAPSGVGAVGVHNAAVVFWNAAMSPSGPITSYTAKAMPAGKTCTWTTGPLTCTITGLVDRTDYVVTVTATNASGTGPPSGWGAFVTPLPGATYFPLTPTRLLDTRNGTGLSGPSGSHSARTFQVTGWGVVPAVGATAVTGNLTVTGQTSNGYLYIGPTAMTNPTSSTLNFPVGDDRANAVTVALGTLGTLSFTFVAPKNRPHGPRDLRCDRLLRARQQAARHIWLSTRRASSTPDPAQVSPGHSATTCRAYLGVAGHGGVACQRSSRDRQPDSDRPDEQRLPVHRAQRHQRSH